MMRITRVPGTDGVARLSVEGGLAEIEGTELATSCEAYLGARHPLLLYLSGVTFVDAQGLGLLHAAAQRGAVLTGCSPLLRRMLGGPQGEAESTSSQAAPA